MNSFEEELEHLIDRAKEIKAPINTSLGGINKDEYNAPSEIWMNDAEIFYNKYLQEHVLIDRIRILLIHRKYR